MIRLLTPTSHLFADFEHALAISRASDALELRPEYGSQQSDSGTAPITHAHISNFRYDLNLPWSSEIRDELGSLIRGAPQSLEVVTFHISRDTEDSSLDELGRFVGSSRPMGRSHMLLNCATNSTWLRSSFPNLVFGIENNNFYPTGAYDIATSPDFISEVCAENNLAFLFDVAHAQVTAGNQGIDLRDYVAALPLARLIQIHLSRPSIRPSGEWYDAHKCPGLLDLEIVEDLIGRSGIESYPITVEFYGSTPDLIRALDALRRG